MHYKRKLRIQLWCPNKSAFGLEFMPKICPNGDGYCLPMTNYISYNRCGCWAWVIIAYHSGGSNPLAPTISW